MIKYVIFKDKQEEQKQTTDVVYRLNCVENKMEELFEVTGFEESDETCKAIFEEIRDNYDFYANEIYPVIRFEDDTEFVGVIGILVPIVVNGKVYGMNMDCEPETLEIAGTICKELYDVDENDDDYDAKWEMLKDAIQQYHLFDEVCEFVADKIIEMNEPKNCYYWYHHGAMSEEELKNIGEIIRNHDYEEFVKVYTKWNNNDEGLIYFPLHFHNDDFTKEYCVLNKKDFELITYNEYECG